MNITQVKALLVLIESYDRTPFRPEAVDLWFESLRNVAAEDAEAAVHHIFRIDGRDERGGIRKLLPGDVRRPAEAIAASRYRKAAQKAVEGARPRVGSTGRPEAVEAALARARAKVEAAEAEYRKRVSVAA